MQVPALAATIHTRGSWVTKHAASNAPRITNGRTSVSGPSTRIDASSRYSTIGDSHNSSARSVKVANAPSTYVATAPAATSSSHVVLGDGAVSTRTAASAI